MPCIRRRYHYNNVYLNPQVIAPSHPLCGQTVPVYSHGHVTNTFLAGFIKLEDFSGPGAIITHISAFSHDQDIAGKWIEYERDKSFLGKKHNNQVFLVYDNNGLITLGSIPDVDTVNYTKDNVTQISKFKK